VKLIYWGLAGSDVIEWECFEEWNAASNVAKERMSWDALETWNLSFYRKELGPSWKVFDEIQQAYSKVVLDRQGELTKLLTQWNRRLKKLGGDPTYFDWRKFRPLRLTREEDWSDWLGFLIEKSEGGVFSHYLFGDSDHRSIDYESPIRVMREVASSGYRADLIVEWKNQILTHIEIKVGDPNLAKTFITSRVMRSHFKKDPEHWRNCLLILPDQIPAWDRLDHHVPGEPGIKVLTWEEVAIVLRRAITVENSISWQSWAYAFLGAIEQHLVKYPGHKINERPVINLDAKIRILREGME